MGDDHAQFELQLKAKGYRPVGWVDVIDECDFKDRRTGKKVYLDAERLGKIAEKRNRLVEGRRSVVHYCLGHTKDDAPEWEQPPVVGLSSRWRVGQYPDGTACLEAYSWEKPGHEGVFEKYPQRSAELFLDPDDINPVALLASTTPRRDLSLRLSRFDDEPEVASTGSVVRFCRDAAETGERQPVLFSLAARPIRNAEPGSPRCKVCQADLDPQEPGLLGEPVGQSGVCPSCQVDQLQGALARLIGPGSTHAVSKAGTTGVTQIGDPEPVHNRRPNRYSHQTSAAVDAVHGAQAIGKKRDPKGAAMDQKVKFDDPALAASVPPPAGVTGASPADQVAEQASQGQDFKSLQASVTQIQAMLAKWAPALDMLSQEIEAEQAGGMAGAGGPGGSPTAGGPPGAPPGGPAGPPEGGPEMGPEPGPEGEPGGEPEEEEEPEPKGGKDGPPSRNSAGSTAGYGNTYMPTSRNSRYEPGYGADPETAIRMQRLEQENLDARRANAELLKRLESTAKETAALKLQRLEDETNALLNQLDREGVTVDREYDFPRLVRMSKADREREAGQMRKLRAKKEPALPNGGQLAVDPAAVAAPEPIKMSRLSDGFVLPGDPAAPKVQVPDDYDLLVEMAGQARQAGKSVKSVLAPPAPAAAAPVAVR